MKKLLPLIVLLFSVSVYAQKSTVPGLMTNYTVATLPTSHQDNVLYHIEDGASASDCTVGGGTTYVICKWNGSAYAAVGGASGLTVGTTAITSGTGGRVLYETAGNKVGEISGATSDGTTLTLVAPILGIPASGTATNLTGLPLTTGVIGVLPVANGGTNCSVASITCINNISGGSLAGAVVGTTDAQELTVKTLTSSVGKGTWTASG